MLYLRQKKTPFLVTRYYVLKNLLYWVFVMFWHVVYNFYGLFFRLYRILQKNDFAEAEKFAILFGLDIEVSVMYSH